MCGFIERSGQGVNSMYEESIRQAKLPPDFTGTDDYQVVVRLPGEVQSHSFLRYLERVSHEAFAPFSTHDFRILDLLHRQQPLPPHYRDRVIYLRDLGVIESFGRGRGVRYILSRKYYDSIGEAGTYTRRRGLDRETNKALLLQHIEHSGTTGCQMSELLQVLPNLSREMVKRLLGELRNEGLVYLEGRTRNARWYANPGDIISGE